MQGMFTTVNLLVLRNALKAPNAGMIFFCSSVFLEADHSGKKWGRKKKDTNATILFTKIQSIPTLARTDEKVTSTLHTATEPTVRSAVKILAS